MKSLPRGFAIVITMTKGCPGADVDERDISELFQQLHFDVIALKDKTKKVKRRVCILQLDDSCVKYVKCKICKMS